jgi:hypothetical protein
LLLERNLKKENYGGAIIFGVFRVKNHDFTQKKIKFFPILGGAPGACAPPLDPPLNLQQLIEVIVCSKASF